MQNINSTNQKQIQMMNNLFKEIKKVREKINKVLAVIPEESLNEYKNKTEIKKAYLEAKRSM